MVHDVTTARNDTSSPWSQCLPARDAAADTPERRVRPPAAACRGRSVPIYETTSPEAMRQHASFVDLPVDEIIHPSDTALAGPNPQSAAA